MPKFIPCSGCHRHVRASDVACPFCGEVMADAVKSAQLASRSLARSTTGLKRAALFALGTSLTAAACGGDDDSSQSDIAQRQGEDGMEQPPTSNGPEGTDDGDSMNENPTGQNPSEADPAAPNPGAPENPAPGPVDENESPPPPTNQPNPESPVRPIDDDISEQPLYGAPVRPIEPPPEQGVGGTSNAGGAGGAIDEETDAGTAPADAGADDDEEGFGGRPQAVPLYGAIPAPIDRD